MGNQTKLGLGSADLDGLSVEVDDRDHLKPGPKFYEWEKKVDGALEEQAKKDVKGWAAFRDSGDAESYKKLADEFKKL